MNRLRKHLTIDGLIMLFASITLVVSVLLFFSDGFFAGDTKGLVAVGKFDVSRNDVRRRVDAGLTWNNVSTPDTVYEGDSIFTGDGSEATVVLDNGSTIKIDPKSLVVIRTRGSKTEIDLQYGSLQGKVAGANGILLTQNGVSQELSSADAEVRIVKSENDKNTKVQVMKGDLQIGDKGVKQDEVAELEANKAASVKKAPITLLAPTSGASMWVPMGASVAFKWKSSGTEEGKFEVSKDTSFTSPSFSGDVKGTSYELAEASRPSGAFYWRISPKGGEPSMPGRLSVYPDVAPLPVLPTEGQEYWIEAAAGDQKSVFFTWEDKAGSSSYKIQVAHDEKFTEIVYENTTKSQVDRAKLPKGAYVWRVMGMNPERKNAPWSRLVAFYVKSGSKMPEIPKITTTKLTYEIPHDVLKSMSDEDMRAGRGVKPVGIKPFSWEAAPNATSYEVEMAQDETFKNSVRQDTNGATTFAPSEVKPGSVFVRVRAKGEGGRLSKGSEPAHLVVSLPAPKLDGIPDKREVFKTDKDLKAAKHEFTMKWSALPWVASYELEWGADSEFKKSKKFNVTETNRSIDVSKPMDYAARVRGLAADGTPLTPFSETRVASYKKEMFVPKPVAVKPKEEPRKPAAIPKVTGLSKDIPVPKLKEPRPRTSLISLENAPTFVSFRWNSFESAAYYTIQIASDADFTNVVAEQKVYKTAYVFEKPLPEGKVYWRVRAHTKTAFSEWSDPCDLNVIYQ